MCSCLPGTRSSSSCQQHPRLTLFYFWPHRATCGIIVPQPGMDTGPPAVEAPSPNHWTARELPQAHFKELPLLHHPCALGGVTAVLWIGCGGGTLKPGHWPQGLAQRWSHDMFSSWESAQDYCWDSWGKEAFLLLGLLS